MRATAAELLAAAVVAGRDVVATARRVSCHITWPYEALIRHREIDAQRAL